MRGNSVGWANSEVVAALALGFLLAAAFVAWELRAREPMLPMRFFRCRAFSSGIATSFLFYGSMYGVLFFLPQFLQVAQGYGSLGAGLRLLPWTATLLVFAPIAGALVNRIGERSLLVVGLLLQAVGMTWMGLIAVPDLAYAKFIVPLILSGAGASIAMPAAQNAVVSAVPATEVGKASGAFNMSRFLGGVFGIATLVAVFSGTGGFGSAQVFSAGFARAIGVSAALSLVAALVGMGLPGRHKVTLAQAKAKA
jgi:MFS family permease